MKRNNTFIFNDLLTNDYLSDHFNQIEQLPVTRVTNQIRNFSKAMSNLLRLLDEHPHLLESIAQGKAA